MGKGKINSIKNEEYTRRRVDIFDFE